MMSSVHTADTEAPTEANPGLRGRAAWPLELPLGAHLSTSRFGYTHHGVYAGHGRVVHYSGLSGFGSRVQSRKSLYFDLPAAARCGSSSIPELRILRRKSCAAPARAWVKMTTEC